MPAKYFRISMFKRLLPAKISKLKNKIMQSWTMMSSTMFQNFRSTEKKKEENFTSKIPGRIFQLLTYQIDHHSA